MPSLSIHRRAFLSSGLAATALPVAARTEGDLTALYDRLWAERQAAADPEAKRAHAREALRALGKVEARGLSFDAGLGLAAIRWSYASEAEARERFRFGTIGARFSPWVVTHLTGNHLNPGPKSGTLFGTETAQIRRDLESGVVPPAFLVDRTVARLKAAPPSAELAEQIALFEEVRPKAPAEPGVWRLPHGDEWYTIAFRDQISAEISIDEARRRGRAEAAELTAEADAILRSRGRSSGTVAERLRALGADASQIYPDSSAGRDRAVAAMNASIAAIRPRLAAAFTMLSPAEVAVRRMSGEDEAKARAGYREAPSFDGAKPGAYFVDLAKIGERPAFSLPTAAMHECLPGHLLQMPIQASLNLHPLRAALGSHAYSEGWAVYAEELADELGLYADDPLGRLGYVQSRLFRVARLLADIGLNRDRWSIDQATAFIAGTTGEKPEAVRADAERYCVWPGQIASYAVGRWTFAGLRGRRPLPRFHEAVLSHGPLPAPVLRRTVDNAPRFPFIFGSKERS